MMVKIRILKRQEKYYAELPQELCAIISAVGQNELELFHLRDGHYFLSLSLPPFSSQPTSVASSAALPPLSSTSQVGGNGSAPQSVQPQLTEPERLLLKKLFSVKFENRTPAHLASLLSDQDKATLSELIGRGIVNLYKSAKYKEGVYSIQERVYPLINLVNQPGAHNYPSGEPSPQNQQNQPSQPNQQTQASEHAQSIHPASASPQPLQTNGQQVHSSPPLLALLHTDGFLIIQDKREAVALSDQLSIQMKTGAVFGIKGFDGKFYIVTRDYLSKNQVAILNALKEDMDADAIASAVKMSPDGCRAVLRILAENGDIIEKKRGVFAAV